MLVSEKIDWIRNDTLDRNVDVPICHDSTNPSTLVVASGATYTEVLIQSMHHTVFVFAGRATGRQSRFS